MEICEHCGKAYSTKNSLKTHKWREHNSKRVKSLTCLKCGSSFASAYHLRKHSRSCTTMTDSVVKPEQSSCTEPSGCNDRDMEHKRQCNSDEESYDLAPEEPVIDIKAVKRITKDDIPRRDLYQKNWPYIRTHYHRAKYRNVYNWRIDANDIDVEGQLWAVFYKEIKNICKANVSYGFVLRDITDGSLRYYHSSANEGRVLQRPFTISTKKDFARFVKFMYNQDVLEGLKMQRHDTKSIVDTVTNITLYLDKIQNTVGPIGACDEIPLVVKNNKYVVTLDKTSRGVSYTDRKCLFRAVAYHRGKRNSALDKATAKLFKSYARDFDINVRSFRGVTLRDLDDIERWLKVSINVLSMNDDDSVRYVQRSFRRYDDVMYLLLCGNHFAYITNIKKFAKIFKCVRCEKIFRTSTALVRHERTCSMKTIFAFPSGSFLPSKTVFDKLAEHGVIVSPEMRYYPYHCVYDIEVYFDKDELPANSEKLSWEARHNLASISVCSNVENFEEAKCFVSEGDPQNLVDEFMEYLYDIADQAYENLRERFSDVFDQLYDKNKEQKYKEKLAQIEKESNTKMNGGGDLNERSEKKQDKTELELLVTEFDQYLREVPVFGFCSSSYDICVLKKYVIKHMFNKMEPINFVIRKQSKYVCISSERLRWLDAAQYVVSTCSLDQYLKAYGAKVGKERFPYNWFTGLEKLRETKLPEKVCFYNDLKDENIPDDCYERCKELFETKCKTMRDYLVLYNNADVIGLTECLTKQKSFYRELGVDFSKDGISLPGLSQRILFKTLPEGVYFPFFAPKHSHLYELYRSNIFGGQSIVLHRYVGPDYPLINERIYGIESRSAKKVLGFDCTALYLYSMAKNPMPCNEYVLYTPDENGVFKRERPHKYGHMAVEWLMWQELVHDCKIKHQFNFGEKRVGKDRIQVDGWAPAGSNHFPETCWEFLGCHFHSHHCSYTDFKSDRSEEDALIHREKLKQRFDYLESLGLRVFYIYECEWIKEIEANPLLESFLCDIRDKYNHDTNLTEERIIELVKSGDLFGSCEIDIEVPNHLWEYFSIFQPLFKHAMMSRNDLSQSMRMWCENHNVLRKPRKTLVNSYYAEKILIYTPLLQWYLKHGLTITKVYSFIENEAKFCFEKFGDKVVAARREGDNNPANSVISNSWKLTGNASYGRFLLDSSKHTNVSFRQDDDSNVISDLINSNQYKNLELVHDDIYEIELYKKRIMLNSSVQIGHAILSIAKKRLLEFVYDCLDRFVDRKDCMLLYSDTDSAYCCISQNELFQVVKPHLRDIFVNEYESWFPMEYCKDHKTAFFMAKFAGNEWVQEACCRAVSKHELRSPGLFHLEAEATSFAGLNSKTYILQGGTQKYSSKGLSHKLNKVKMQQYVDILKTESTWSGVNRGFRKRGNNVFTYEQAKTGLSYFYGKLRVSEDGITCLPTFM